MNNSDEDSNPEYFQNNEIAPEDREKALKKIRYKIEKRGWKETTLLLKKLLPDSLLITLNNQELKLLEDFLHEPDMDIFKWLYYDYTIPDQYKSLCEKMLKANNNNI